MNTNIIIQLLNGLSTILGCSAGILKGAVEIDKAANAANAAKKAAKTVHSARIL